MLAVYAAALWTCGFARIAFIGLLVRTAAFFMLAIYAAAYGAGIFRLLIYSALLSVLAIYTTTYLTDFAFRSFCLTLSAWFFCYICALSYRDWL